MSTLLKLQRYRLNLNSKKDTLLLMDRRSPTDVLFPPPVPCTVPRACIASWTATTVEASSSDMCTWRENIPVTEVELALVDCHWSIYVADTPEEIEKLYLATEKE